MSLSKEFVINLLFVCNKDHGVFNQLKLPSLSWISSHNVLTATWCYDNAQMVLILTFAEQFVFHLLLWSELSMPHLKSIILENVDHKGVTCHHLVTQIILILFCKDNGSWQLFRTLFMPYFLYYSLNIKIISDFSV